MSTLLIQEPLSYNECERILSAFPQLRLAPLFDTDFGTCQLTCFDEAEVFFGRHFDAQLLAKCPKLRWIHSPASDFSEVEQHAAKEKELLLSCAKPSDPRICAQFVLTFVWAQFFGLFSWKKNSINSFSPPFIPQKTSFLQIGLGNEGSSIADLAKQGGFKVYGASNKRRYHPSCAKTISFSELHGLLPHVDIISININKNELGQLNFGKKEFSLIRPHSILAITGSLSVIDEGALCDAAFYACVVDTRFSSKQNPSQLLAHPRLTLTQSLSRSVCLEKNDFSQFFFNLRQYLHGHYREMKSLQNTAL